MQTPEEALAAMQKQALDAIRTGQAQTLGAVRNWYATVGQHSPATPDLSPEMREALGDPAKIVDSVYDFASQLLDLNKEFVHQLLQSAPTSEK